MCDLGGDSSWGGDGGLGVSKEGLGAGVSVCKAEEAKISGNSPFEPKRKKKPTANHNGSHFGLVTPTVLQSGGGGDRSRGFIAVEERTRKMLTAFMCCGINNNRLRLYCVL